MSSWAQDMYDAGFTSEHGGLMDSIGHSFSKSLRLEQESIEINKEPQWFATAQEAQDYAKKNIGIVITRSPDGDGYIVKKK